MTHPYQQPDDAWADYVNSQNRGMMNMYKPIYTPAVLEEAVVYHDPNIGTPQAFDLGPIKRFIWNWFDSNLEVVIYKGKVLFFTFTVKIKHCELFLKLLIGDRE